jgi:multiple sugar transport system substrate-binding protein
VELSRRGLLRGAAGVAGLGALTSLTGCSSSALSGLTTARETAGSVEYWNLFGGGDGIRMQDMEDGYRAAHRGVELSAVTFAWGNPYYTKLSLATIGQKPPDVAVAHLTRMKSLVAAGLVQELTQPELAAAGMTSDKFSRRPWEAGLVDGKVFAVPLDTHPFVMFYNTDVCKKAGLLAGDGTLAPMNSADAFRDALRKAKAVTGAAGAALAITNEIPTPWRIFQCFYSQLGGEMLAQDGTEVTIDDAKALQVLQFLRSLTADGLIPPALDYQGSIATFANGDAGFYFQGEWEISTFQTAKLPFGMTLFPNVFGGDKYSVQADSHTLLVPRQPTDDPAQRQRALQFVRSMLDQSKTWAEGGHIPAWLPYRDTPEYKQLRPQSNYADADASAVYDPEGWYSGSGSNFEIVTGQSIGAVLSGQLTPQDGLAQMTTKLRALAATPSPI